MTEKDNFHLQLFEKMEDVAKLAFAEGYKNGAVHIHNDDKMQYNIDYFWQHSDILASINRWKEYAKAGVVVEMAQEVMKSE